MPNKIITASYNEHSIKPLKWSGKDTLLIVGECLLLQLRRSSKTWLVRRRISGKTSITTIEKHPEISLKKARIEAIKITTSQTFSVLSVEELVKKYMNEVVEPKHKRPELTQGYMDRAVLPAFGSKKVRDITRAQLVDLIQDYSTRGVRTADQLRSNLKKLFSYAVEIGHRDDNPMLEVSSRITGYTPTARDRVLSDDEIKQMWSWKNSPQAWQRTEENTRILRFLLLTGLRISEAQKGHRKGNKWIVPKEWSVNTISYLDCF